MPRTGTLSDAAMIVYEGGAIVLSQFSPIRVATAAFASEKYRDTEWFQSWATCRRRTPRGLPDGGRHELDRYECAEKDSPKSPFFLTKD